MGSLKRKKQMTVDEAKIRLADLCSRSEQCSFDIRQKLYKWGFNSSTAEEIINLLIERKFLSDRRYAGAYASDKVRFASWGRNKIRLSLKIKRIPDEIISEALADINPDDYKAAIKRVAERKARNLNLNDREDRLKLYRHLLSRGFESNIISRLLSTARQRNV
ncbi:MAG: RecX family transcriptional regulator [Muribaculaceae bacterium]|nr:RecX family transcriptional regulator [Muribaculaceae bacterium]